MFHQTPPFALFIKSLFERTELILSEYTAFPPCLNKAEAITHKLDKGCRNTLQTYFQTAILS